MKAFLLAAGLGSRLRPITDHVPKCLVPIAGKPLLQIWLELLRRYGIQTVMINTHYRPEQVRQFASTWSGPPEIHLSHEDTLLGSAGTLEKNWEFVAGEQNFLVCNVDTLTDVNLQELVCFHQSHGGLLTMALFVAKRPNECGIAEIDERGLVLGFEEKPTAPKSPLGNGGIYVMRSGIHSRFPLPKPSDIGFDLLPRCSGEMYGWLWPGLLTDIGNPQAYTQAQELWVLKQDSCARKIGLSVASRLIR